MFGYLSGKSTGDGKAGDGHWTCEVSYRSLSVSFLFLQNLFLHCSHTAAHAASFFFSMVHNLAVCSLKALR